MTQVVSVEPVGPSCQSPLRGTEILSPRSPAPHVAARRLAAGATLALALSLAACTAPPERPDPTTPTRSATTATATPVDTCPAPGTRIERWSWPDRRALLPFNYAATRPGELCLVTPHDLWNYRTLLGMRFYEQGDPNIAALARAVGELFPLRVGNRSFASVTGMASTGGETFLWTYEFEVIGREWVNAVETFVILLKERGQPPNMFGVDTRVWIDPQRRVPLRIRNTIHRSGDPNRYRDWDATSVLMR